MKTLNQFRSTDKFCITNPSIGHLAKIAEHFGRDLITIGCDNDDFIYTVRTSNSDGLTDYRIKVYDSVQIIEKIAVHSFHVAA
jgi:hypothetical protein